MTLESILPQSLFATIATIDKDSAEKFYGYYKHNQGMVSRFDNILLVANMADNCTAESLQEFIEMFLEIYPNAQYKVLNENNFHMFGTIDLDEECLRYCKSKGLKYLWKSTHDVLHTDVIFNKVYETLPDFLYLPGFSLETLMEADMMNLDFVTHYEEYLLSPQTNFFILDVTKVTNLYGYDIFTKKSQYLEVLKTSPKLKPWDMRFSDGIKFACEDHLAVTVKSLTKANLLSDTSFYKLCQHVLVHKVADPSHKQIFLTEVGVGHMHTPTYEMYAI
jgi:hypothetical protein